MGPGINRNLHDFIYLWIVVVICTLPNLEASLFSKIGNVTPQMFSYIGKVSSIAQPQGSSHDRRAERVNALTDPRT